MNDVDPWAGSPGDLWLIAVFVGVPLAAAFLYGVLILTAALGLTSFTMFERFRRKPEEPEDDGIDGLF